MTLGTKVPSAGWRMSKRRNPNSSPTPYILRGALTVLDGNMGQGKSTFTCAIAAAVTTGQPPLFVDKIEEGPVLFMSAEDDPSRVLKPRLMQAGADVSKVRYQEEPFTLDERGLILLRLELAANTSALVVIDPIIAFMKEDADGNKATETMHFMVQIDQLAREFDTAILIVRHLRKARADHVAHQGIGSISISARVDTRAAHHAVPTGRQPGRQCSPRHRAPLLRAG